jgi:23S rRNA pseudouridine2605 synthase
MLALAGLGSRRDMEDWIAAGRVSLNGQVAAVGARVGSDDKVRVDGHEVKLKFERMLPRVLLYNKVEGEIVSRDDPEHRATVFERLPRLRGAKWIAVGRLDFNTGGLLLFTTDGELANRLMHPSFEVDREYAVRVLGELTKEQADQMTRGIELEDGRAHFDQVRSTGGEGANKWYHVTLKEGKKREVRRMFEAMGLTVSRLIRVGFGPVQLPARLKRGMWLELSQEDVIKLLSWTGMKGYIKPQLSERIRDRLGAPNRTKRNTTPDRREAPPPREGKPPRAGKAQEFESGPGKPRAAKPRDDAPRPPRGRRDDLSQEAPRGRRGRGAPAPAKPDSEPRPPKPRGRGRG